MARAHGPWQRRGPGGDDLGKRWEIEELCVLVSSRRERRLPSPSASVYGMAQDDGVLSLSACSASSLSVHQCRRRAHYRAKSRAPLSEHSPRLPRSAYAYNVASPDFQYPRAGSSNKASGRFRKDAMRIAAPTFTLALQITVSPSVMIKQIHAWIGVDQDTEGGRFQM